MTRPDLYPRKMRFCTLITSLRFVAGSAAPCWNIWTRSRLDWILCRATYTFCGTVYYQRQAAAPSRRDSSSRAFAPVQSRPISSRRRVRSVLLRPVLSHLLLGLRPVSVPSGPLTYCSVQFLFSRRLAMNNAYPNIDCVTLSF